MTSSRPCGGLGTGLWSRWSRRGCDRRQKSPCAPCEGIPIHYSRARPCVQAGGSPAVAAVSHGIRIRSCSRSGNGTIDAKAGRKARRKGSPDHCGVGVLEGNRSEISASGRPTVLMGRQATRAHARRRGCARGVLSHVFNRGMDDEPLSYVLTLIPIRSLQNSGGLLCIPAASRPAGDGSVH